MNGQGVMLGLSALVAMPELLLAQVFNEKSIPEPTRLASVASGPGVEVRAVGIPVSVTSHESSARIGSVEVRTENGQRRCGLKLVLENPKASDTLLLDLDEAAQLREEFAGLDALRDERGPCEAISMCVTGVARCRPSQTSRQAFCPSAYLTAQGERGVQLSSSLAGFSFPVTEASVFVSAIDAVAAKCKETAANQNVRD